MSLGLEPAEITENSEFRTGEGCLDESTESLVPVSSDYLAAAYIRRGTDAEYLGNEMYVSHCVLNGAIERFEEDFVLQFQRDRHLKSYISPISTNLVAVLLSYDSDEDPNDEIIDLVRWLRETVGNDELSDRDLLLTLVQTFNPLVFLDTVGRGPKYLAQPEIPGNYIKVYPGDPNF